MNTLGLYIKEALQDKREICLPGIGTFTKERIPAFFNDLKQCFMPPAQNIVLNDKQQESDYSLIEFIAKKEGINFEESRSKLKQSISELEYEFENKEEILLKGLGILKKAGDHYEFTYYSPNPEGTYNDYEPIEEVENLIPLKEKVNISASTANLNNNKEQLIEEPATYEEDLEEETSSRKWLWPALALIACVAIGGFWFLNPNFNFNDLLKTNKLITSNNQITEQATVETSAVQPNEIKSQAPESTEPIIQNTDSLLLSTPSEGMLRESQGRFEIIIAAFNTMEEAESYVNRTNAKGYNVYILKNNNPGNLNKISYGPFQTAEEADQALAKVREELTKEAWIYESKK